MRIQIAERFKPYSHIPGEFCLIPGTFFRCQIFPTLIRIDTLSSLDPEPFAEIQLNVQGPLKDFTILQNLEKGTVQVWGHTQTGYIRYSLTPFSGNPTIGLLFRMEKMPQQEITLNSFSCSPGIALLITKTHIEKKEQQNHLSVFKTERLSLGYHKAQDWTMMRRRGDLGEIMPLWFRLGGGLSCPSDPILGGTAALLRNCRQAILEEDRLNILKAFMAVFLAGFEGVLSPRLTDTQYQGFHLPQLERLSGLSPLVLLSEGARLIRSLFVQAQDNKIAILPVLPVEFHCGRLVGVNCRGLNDLAMEWSKKTIRRVSFRSTDEGKILFAFKNVNSFRLRHNKSDRGKRISCGEFLFLEKNSEYFMDNFMH